MIVVLIFRLIGIYAETNDAKIHQKYWEELDKEGRVPTKNFGETEHTNESHWS